MFILLVEVEVHPEMVGEFSAAIRNNASASVEREDGCVRFDAAVGIDARNQFVFWEVYTNEEAWKAHRRTDHFLDYQEVADRALITRRVTRLEALSGHLPK